jgi:hypothetical protein
MDSLAVAVAVNVIGAGIRTVVRRTMTNLTEMDRMLDDWEGRIAVAILLLWCLFFTTCITNRHQRRRGLDLWSFPDP